MNNIVGTNTTELQKECKKLVELFGANNIYLSFDDQARSLLVDNYTIFYSSKLSAIQTLKEIFVDIAYYFHTDKTNPFIIDAGSEVGMATIFFKIFYPEAKILCFEAHPHSFELLKKNIEVNELNAVIPVNVALTNKEGEIDFFGEFDYIGDELDTRGNSIIKEWGLQRETSKMISVPAAKLSGYINEEVDYLKLNIEGAEQQVLEDLETANKMRLIDRILIKFHQSSKIQNINNLDYSLWLLAKNKFEIDRRLKKDIGKIFPNVTKGWAAENEVCLHTLSVKKKDSKKRQPKTNSLELQKKLYLLRKTFLEKETFLLRSIIDNVPSSIYWKDKDGYYLGHSAYAIEQLHNTNIAPNATMKNIVGKSDYDIFTKEAADKYRKNDLYIMENKKNLVLEENIKTPAGRDLIQLSSKKPMYNEKMEVVGVIGSTIDITDHRKTELLQKEKEVAEKISNTLEVLSGNIAHEIKTPLAIINSSVDNLNLELEKLLTNAKDKASIDKINGFTKTIKSTVFCANNIISMLLIKIRSILGKAKLDSSNSFNIYSIKSCVDRAVKEYPFRESELELINWNLSNEDFNYKGNELLTKHILFNLIKNSLWAIKEAGKGKFYISLRSDADFNHLIFKDTASGISSDKLQSIFEQFDSSRKGGAGLGLPFCKMTMQSYGGDIVCNSKVGEYAEFDLSFPKI